MTDPINNRVTVPEYLAYCTGGELHQIYKRNPLGDNGDDNLSYINHTPHIIYKSKEACEKAIEALRE